MARRHRGHKRKRKIHQQKSNKRGKVVEHGLEESEEPVAEIEGSLQVCTTWVI